METTLEIIKFTLPSLIVFFTAYFLVKTLIDNERSRRKHEAMATNQKISTPLRLKAYERLILYLERISPNSVLPRLAKANMSAQQLQKELIRTIREEFEHNLSQQVYIEDKGWQAVVAAKENMTKLANMIAARVITEGKQQEKEVSAADFAKLMLETVIEMKDNPTSTAISILKKEAKELFA